MIILIVSVVLLYIVVAGVIIYLLTVISGLRTIILDLNKQVKNLSDSDLGTTLTIKELNNEFEMLNEKLSQFAMMGLSGIQRELFYGVQLWSPKSYALNRAQELGGEIIESDKRSEYEFVSFCNMPPVLGYSVYDYLLSFKNDRVIAFAAFFRFDDEFESFDAYSTMRKQLKYLLRGESTLNPNSESSQENVWTMGDVQFSLTFDYDLIGLYCKIFHTEELSDNSG